FDMAVLPGDPEAELFLGQLSKTLQLAGWQWVDFAGPSGPLALTYTWPGLPNVGQMGAFGVDIFIPLDHGAELSTAAASLSTFLKERGFSLGDAPKVADAAQGFSNHTAMHIV